MAIDKKPKPLRDITMGRKEKVLTEKGALEVYDVLREAHHLLTDRALINYDLMSNKQMNAIDAVTSVLYLAEGVFAKND